MKLSLAGQNFCEPKKQTDENAETIPAGANLSYSLQSVCLHRVQSASNHVHAAKPVCWNMHVYCCTNTESQKVIKYMVSGRWPWWTPKVRQCASLPPPAPPGAGLFMWKRVISTSVRPVHIILIPLPLIPPKILPPQEVQTGWCSLTADLFHIFGEIVPKIKLDRNNHNSNDFSCGY